MLPTLRLPALLIAILVVHSSDLSAQSTGSALREILREKMKFTPEQIREVRQKRGESKSMVLGGAKPVSTDNVVSADHMPESEVHAAINPRDSSNIIISAIRSGADPSEGMYCPIYYTTDFGGTWQKSEFRTVPSAEDAGVMGGGDPILVYDANGRAYISWIDLYTRGTETDAMLYFALFWAYSDDGGATWTRPEKELIGVGSAPVNDWSALDVFDKQWMAVDRSESPYRNTLYTVFMQMSADAPSGMIGLRKKPAGVDAFTERTVRISGAEAAQVQLASIDIDLEGTVHVSYYGVSLDGRESLWHARSTDGGETFSAPRKISDLHLPSEVPGLVRLQACSHLVVDVGNGPTRGNLYQIWSADGLERSGTRGMDIYFSRSTDKGATWSRASVINSDPPLTGTHQFHPSLAVNTDGVVTATWYDRRGDNRNIQTNYYIAHSFDGGRTFEPGVPVSSSPTDFSTVGMANGDFGIGEYTQVLSIPGYAIPVWADGRANDGNLDIYVAFVPIGKAGVAAERAGAIGAGARLLDPRPSRSGYSVGFHLERAGAVKLILVDALGRTVSSIVDAELTPGNHYYRLETESISSGRYHLALMTSTGQVARQIDLVR